MLASARCTILAKNRRVPLKDRLFKRTVELDLNGTRERGSLVDILRNTKPRIHSQSEDIVIKLVTSKHFERVRPVSRQQAVVQFSRRRIVDPGDVKESVNVWITATRFIRARKSRIVSEQAAPQVRRVDIPVIRETLVNR